MTQADLNAVASPDEIPIVLRNAADAAIEASARVSEAWQTDNPGKPWDMIARELNNAADRIERGLIRLGW